jgi:PAS domain S-box-containing protein
MSKSVDEAERRKAQRRRKIRRMTDETSVEILESMSDAFVALDSEWRYIYVNRAAERLARLRREDILGRTIEDLFPSEGAKFEKVCRRAMDEGVTVQFENYFAPFDVWFEHTIYPSSGGVNVYARDITERKLAEEALRRAHEELEQRVVERTSQLSAINEELLKEITEREHAEEELRRSEAYLVKAQRLSHTGSGAWNVSTGEAFWSQETYRLYGFDPESVKPSPELFFQIIHPDERLFVQQYFERVARERGDYELEFRIVRPDGIIRHIHSVGHPVFNEAGDLVELVGTVMDITERKNAEEALQDEIEERRRIEAERGRLLRRIVLTQEEERSRIAREMHDQFGQQLSALNLKLAVLQQACGEQTELREQTESLQAIARQLDTDVEFLVWELRPTTLDDLGLLAALTNYLKNWSKHVGIHAELHTRGMEKDRLTEEIETVLYRVMQEALNNVAKHAGAENVDILLERRSDQVSLIVEDDGDGFDDEHAFDEGQKGLGLMGMRERTALVGGMFEIESSPGDGTTVVVRIPAPHVPNGGEPQ